MELERARTATVAWVIGRACACLVLATVHVDFATAASGGPIDQRTGAPAELGGFEETCVSCHSSFDLDSGPGLLEISAPGSYEPGVTYDILVSVAQAGRVRWGFETTAIDGLLEGAGSFGVGDDGLTEISITGNREYVKQTSAGSADGQPDEMEWVFSWTAPAVDIGPVTLYAAAVAADSTAGSSGDDVYSAAVSIPVPEPAAAVLQLMACLTLGLLRRR
jgi:hypothetical protein